MDCEAPMIFEVKVANHPWPDFLVMAEVHSHWVDFRAYQVIGRNGTADNAALLFFKKGGKTFPDDSTLDPAEAAPFLSGGIKWDGCSNWDDVPLGHCCGRKDALRVGKLIDALYTYAKEALKATVYEDCFEG